MSVDRFWRLIRPANRLTGRRSFVYIPIFNYPVVWNGASEIITQFNYTAARNFVLPRTILAPTDNNFVACIKWVDVDENVFRYKLWDDSDLRLNVPLVAPNNKIGKEFTIEIWSVEGSSTVSLGHPIKIVTSLLKEITDLTATGEVEEDTTADEVPYSELLNTNLLSNVYSSIADIEAAFAINAEAHYIADIGVTYDLISGKVSSWSDQSGNGRNLIQATEANKPTKFTNGFGAKDKAYVRFSFLQGLSSAVFGNIQPFTTVYALMRVNRHDAVFGVVYSDEVTSLTLHPSLSGYFVGSKDINNIQFEYTPLVPVLARLSWSETGGGPTWTFKGTAGPIVQDIYSDSSAIGPILTTPSVINLGSSIANPAEVEFDIAELIVFREPLGTANNENADMAIRRYLAHKYEGLMEIPFTFSRAAATPITQS